MILLCQLSAVQTSLSLRSYKPNSSRIYFFLPKLKTLGPFSSCLNSHNSHVQGMSMFIKLICIYSHTRSSQRTEEEHGRSLFSHFRDQTTQAQGEAIVD